MLVKLGTNTTIELKQGVYENGRTAIFADDQADGDRYGTLTANIPEAEIRENEIIVKTWSENSFWPQQVLKQLPNVFQDTGKRVQAGYAVAQVWTFNPDGVNASNVKFFRSGGLTSPIVTLTTGINVANFSSPHEFTFDDGSILPSCSPEHARALMLESREVEAPQDRWTDVKLHFTLSSAVRFWLDELNNATEVDLVLVPLPVMEALKDAGLPVGKCRVVRVADRVTKKIHHDRFCI